MEHEAVAAPKNSVIAVDKDAVEVFAPAANGTVASASPPSENAQVLTIKLDEVEKTPTPMISPRKSPASKSPDVAHQQERSPPIFVAITSNGVRKCRWSGDED